MKTQIKIIVPIVIIGSVLSFLVFKTDDTKNIEVIDDSNSEKILSEYKPIDNNSVNISDVKEIFMDPEVELKNLKSKDNISANINEEIETSKEISAVAEDILYPEEYDFSFYDDSDVITSIGHPVKIDTSNFSSLKVGDIFEISFGGDVYKFLIDTVEIEGDGKNYNYYNIKSRSKEFSNKTLSLGYMIDNDFISTEIRIFYNGGYSKSIDLTNGIGYYFDSIEWDKEFSKKGYKID